MVLLAIAALTEVLMMYMSAYMFVVIINKYQFLLCFRHNGDDDEPP